MSTNSTQQTLPGYRSPTELIRARYSCRTYQPRLLSENLRQELDNYAANLKVGPFGNPARFSLVAATQDNLRLLKNLGTYGFIQNASGFFVGTIRSGERNLEDFGYLMELLILYATSLDLGTCWLGGTFTKSSFAEAVQATDEETVPAVASVGYPAHQPRRIERFIRRSAGADRRLAWNRLFYRDEFDLPLTREAAGDFAVPLEMVRLAPSASNKQPWRIIHDNGDWHFYLQRTPGYRESFLVKHFTICDMQRLDMGIAMCHFEISAQELGLQGHWEHRHPGLQVPDALTEYLVSWVENSQSQSAGYQEKVI